MQSGGELQIEVAFADVLRFMRERGAQGGVIPTDGFERQQDAMANGGGRAQIHRETDREASGKLRLRYRERLRATPEPRSENETENDTKQQQSGDREVGGEGDLPPGDVTARRGGALQCSGNRRAD